MADENSVRHLSAIIFQSTHELRRLHFSTRSCQEEFSTCIHDSGIGVLLTLIEACGVMCLGDAFDDELIDCWSMCG